MAHTLDDLKIYVLAFSGHDKKYLALFTSEGYDRGLHGNLHALCSSEASPKP